MRTSQQRFFYAIMGAVMIGELIMILPWWFMLIAVGVVCAFVVPVYGWVTKPERDEEQVQAKQESQS